jgi:hypothetical protein
MTDAEYEHDLTRRALQEADLGGEPDFRAFVQGDDPGLDPQALQERLGIAERWTTGRSSAVTLGLPDGRVVRATVRKTSGRGRNRGKSYLNLTVHGLPVSTGVGWKPGRRYYRLQIGKGAWKETDVDFDTVPRTIRHRDAVRAAYESGLRPAHIPDDGRRRRYAENLRAYGLAATPADATPQKQDMASQRQDAAPPSQDVAPPSQDTAPPSQDAAPPSRDVAPLFTSDDIIYASPALAGGARDTRAQAIEDGVLVDVTATAREAGFRWPVALTAGVWALIEDIPPRFRGVQDIQGRLWDVLWMARCAARRGSGRETSYRLTLHHGRRTRATLKLVSGPGDEGEPVITIMLPGED